MGAIKKGTARERNEFIWRWAFIFPTMLGLNVLNIIPDRKSTRLNSSHWI